MTLQEAFTRIQGDKALTESFSTNPTSVLDKLGVSTSNLRIQTGLKPGEPLAGGMVSNAVAVCGSVGVVVCASVGG